MSAWFRVLSYAPMRLIMKVLAPVAYPFIDKVNDPIWGVNDATDLSYWNIAFRNGAHNFTNRPAVRYATWGEIDESKAGFQWRRRESLTGKYVSFRCAWGEPRSKGKREFYVGWTMNETPYFRLTLQFRPF